MEILKVKLVKHGEQGAKVSLLKAEKDGTMSEVEETRKSPIHQDFKNAMAGLHIHFALNADYVTPKQLKSITNFEPKLIENFYVSGYMLGGDDESKGFMLTGTKMKSNKKAINLNTPFTRFVETEEATYHFIDDLDLKIKTIEEEVKLYLDGKRAPEAQQSIEFPEAPENQDGLEELAEAAEIDDVDDSEDKVKVVKMPTKKAPAKKEKVTAPQKNI